MEPTSEEILNAVNLHGYIPWCEPGDLARGRRIHTFEIQNDNLAIERLQTLNHRGELFDGRRSLCPLIARQALDLL